MMRMTSRVRDIEATPAKKLGRVVHRTFYHIPTLIASRHA
jgi:hypothetical protein